MPDLSYLFVDCFCCVVRSSSIVLSVDNVTLILVCLNILVRNKFSRPMYVNLAHFFFLCVMFWLFFLEYDFI